MSQPRIRGHRRAGPLPVHGEARHFGIGELGAAAIAGIALSAASVAAGTAGAVIAGQQAKSTADYNADIVSQQSELARRAGVAAEADTRLKAERLKAEQRAVLGQSDITTEGTPLLLLLDSSAQAEVEAQRARYTGKVNEQADQANAKLYGARSRQASAGGAFNAGTTLLTGAARVAGDIAYYGRGGGYTPGNANLLN